MAGTFDLNTYRCTYLPSSLWRVAHPESQARKDPVTGDVVAQDRTRAISDELSLKQAAERHFNWTNRQPSCFLSVFSSDTHARRWANQRERTHDLNSIGEVYIQEIDTTKLPADTYVFDAVSLAARLHISHQYSSDEFIFLHRIPGRSLRRTRSLGEIEEQEEEARHIAARPFNPDYHYVSDLGGWYDTDEECEERNRADDLMKMLEGDWNW
ncbi:hypothetical protein MRS44_016417 [Fusarium solani]|uniref:DUF7587 domain-containing protein n=1 Tax=Fusarium solani TaxID=169388 RepID=A0A9P9HCC9_FUSSL|nr:uncharacterized protein B0J15DRAFT_559408 [Fusarium solani]KAH7254928.1 hypothetical protein B0J15DRAFT_559408 [Fusarium solani]KAJ3456394.1 hypothetical protein MRS44_016417 [Fusarium solani]KAJ4211298.1 hypothetical protein NW759_012776 [Fusarium solani]